MTLFRLKLVLNLGTKYESKSILRISCSERKKTLPSKLNKYVSILKAIYKHMQLIMFLICLMSVQALQMSSIESTYSRESSFYINYLSNQIKNYTAQMFNTTTIMNATKKNEFEFFLPNIFPSSLIFYGDENYSNLINRDNIIQKHFINRLPPNNNFNKVQLKYNKKTNKNPGTGASEEDYSYDDYASSMVNKSILNSSGTLACSSCQQHERAKKENLESIKKHILMRLQLSHPPNIKFPPPAVPQNILDYFYKNLNYSSHQSSYKYNSKTYKRSTKNSTPVNVEEKLGDKEYEYRYIDKNYKENDDDDITNEDDIMISDNTFLNDNFPNSMQQVDEFYSRLHKSRIHFNRKPEIFNFKFNNDPSRISSTILHVFIKGLDWIYEYQPELLEKNNISVKSKQEIMIVIYRALKRPNSMNYTHTVKLIESRQKIPAGLGQWVEIEIKELSTYWIKTPNSTQSIVIRGMESWMRTFIVTEDQSNDKLTMHIEIVTKLNHRYKRNTALDCRESDNEVRCCRYPLKVNFTTFGWNFIVAPQHFDAYFCNGECNVGYLEKYTHTHITSLSTSAKPCCSPQKLSPLALLYFDNNNKLMYSTIPNMSVEKCSCS
ncbi:hypothetical protein DOY81_008178 [Sarcophaga bullata]|nr:hypothetical protein DOY81_008178 [Sarcophaga bullata]